MTPIHRVFPSSWSPSLRPSLPSTRTLSLHTSCSLSTIPPKKKGLQSRHSRMSLFSPALQAAWCFRRQHNFHPCIPAVQNQTPVWSQGVTSRWTKWTFSRLALLAVNSVDFYVPTHEPLCPSPPQREFSMRHIRELANQICALLFLCSLWQVFFFIICTL